MAVWWWWLSSSSVDSYSCSRRRHPWAPAAAGAVAVIVTSSACGHLQLQVLLPSSNPFPFASKPTGRVEPSPVRVKKGRGWHAGKGRTFPVCVETNGEARALPDSC